MGGSHIIDLENGLERKKNVSFNVLDIGCLFT